MSDRSRITSHAPNGDFQRDMEQALLDEEAAYLRAAGLTFKEIGEKQGCAVSTAKERVDRALAHAVVEGAKELRVMRAMDLMAQQRELWTIAREEHYHPRRIYQGAPVGEKVVDRSQNIAALRELRQVNESLRKLFGSDAPAQVNVRISDDITDEIARLAGELGLSDAELAEAMS